MSKAGSVKEQGKPATGFHTNPERINRDGAPEKLNWWSQLYMDELERDSRKREGYKKKQSVVAATVEKAEEGESWAVKEVGDRIAGKSKESVDMNIKGTISLVQALQEADE